MELNSLNGGSLKQFKKQSSSIYSNIRILFWNKGLRVTHKKIVKTFAYCKKLPEGKLMTLSCPCFCLSNFSLSFPFLFLGVGVFPGAPGALGACPPPWAPPPPPMGGCWLTIIMLSSRFRSSISRSANCQKRDLELPNYCLYNITWSSWTGLTPFYQIYANNSPTLLFMDWFHSSSQLSNLWWMPNSVPIGFGPAVKMGSSRRFKWYSTTSYRL